ncbi:hypothetical protein BDV25DRAFT_120083 [Aspergillus avenaceus]|uniref:Zn(2)-C6 fungal-type domain-containing protein n=1 Tax=Aspergillus avenaceus TaxID=36643 RepID=A0A5N6TU62_ASPAV|nr:hypothetical protein BDV25DRAFT_120083 [Aspergillus avenaceus]
MARPTQRYACDRCHGQKLRCIHTEGGPCLRCAKAKATCSWSQSLRSNRPKRQAGSMSETPMDTASTTESASSGSPPFGVYMTQPPTPADGDPNMPQFPFTPRLAWGPHPGNYPSPASQEPEPNFNVVTTEGDMQVTPDWMWPEVANCPIQTPPPVNWQQSFHQEWAMMASQHPGAVMEATPPESVSETAEVPKPDCLLATIRDLSELNVELYAHEARVPKPPASLAEPLSWKDKDFAIDRTFQLSQRLIEIVNKRYPRYLETARMENSNVPPEGMPPGPQVDQGSCLLILSCYTRLILTYDRIFENMQGCLDRSSITAREDYVHMPSVQVGSFSLPQSSSLQIVLILQLARQLLTRMGAIIKAVQPQQQENYTEVPALDPGAGGVLMSSALETVSVEEDHLMKRIAKLRSTLIALNIL